MIEGTATDKGFEHHAPTASGAVGLVLAGAVAAFGGRGDRLARWLVGLGGAALAASVPRLPRQGQHR